MVMSSDDLLERSSKFSMPGGPNAPGLPKGSNRPQNSTDKKRTTERSGLSQSSGALKPVTLDDDREPWERQAAEKLNYYRWFQTYLDQDTNKVERSRSAAHRIVCRTVYVNPTLFSHCSKVWRWKDRAEAWDEYVFRTKRNTYLKTIELMAARQARRGVIMASIGAAVIRKFAEKFQAEGAGLALDELRKLFKPAMEAVEIGQREERLARGFQRQIIFPQEEEGNTIDKVLEGLEMEESPELTRAFQQLETVLIQRVQVTKLSRSLEPKQKSLPPRSCEGTSTSDSVIDAEFQVEEED